MSTTVVTSTRRTERPTTSTSRREFITSIIATITSERPSESTTLSRHFSLVDSDTNTPIQNTPEQASITEIPSATASPEPSGVTCAVNSECDSSQICSNGACVKDLNGAPFGPAEGSNLQPASHMSTGSAVALGLGVVSFFILLFCLGIWWWRRRGLKPLHESKIEAPQPNRNRSASTATDQKTLVASLPNSPQYGGFSERHEEMLAASFAQLVSSNKVAKVTSTEKERFACEGPTPSKRHSGQLGPTNEKRLPSPPNDMPLPPEPTEDKRYAINVNINKSMIFDDMMFNMARSNGGTPRDSPRMPKYRFEEYLPPVAQTPPISIRQAPSQRNSEIEMKPYPRKSSSSSAESSSEDESEAETRLKRRSTLKRLESKPPQLPLFDLPPPSPSFSFRSYDWYQDIIGTEQTGTEDPATPAIPDRNPARTPTKLTFGASLCSNPQDIRQSLMPSPLSPTISARTSATHLHPSTAALVSPTSPNFRLSPTVYTMPAPPPKAQPMRASLRSTTTQQNHMSRSWLPEDGIYLPEEGTYDSYTMFHGHLSHASRPTSYSPLQ